MKRLLLILPLLTGCVSGYRPVTDADLAFTIGQTVEVKSGAYRGCTGYVSGVSGYVREKDMLREAGKVQYNLSGVKCKGKDIGKLTGAYAEELKESK